MEIFLICLAVITLHAVVLALRMSLYRVEEVKHESKAKKSGKPVPQDWKDKVELFSMHQLLANEWLTVGAALFIGLHLRTSALQQAGATFFMVAQYSAVAFSACRIVFSLKAFGIIPFALSFAIMVACYVLSFVMGGLVIFVSL